MDIYSKDDKVATPCVKVLKEYYKVYAVINIILFIWYKCISKEITQSTVTTRRSLKVKMRTMICILYPFLYILAIFMTLIMVRIYQLKSSHTINTDHTKQALSYFSVVISHVIFISFEMCMAVKFAV